MVTHLLINFPFCPLMMNFSLSSLSTRKDIYCLIQPLRNVAKPSSMVFIY